MDAAYIFRQGLGTVPPRQYPIPHQIQAYQPPQPYAHNYQNQQRHAAHSPDDLSDGDGPDNRVAHTLTACCRCRQRKTRCDPTLPRCVPCERSGSVCEYLDTTKGRKIERSYVVRLQNKVKALEAELSQYTDEDGEDLGNSEDMVRPGGMIRLNPSDETPRYLGPSSGIAMSRLLVDEAKRFTDSSRISELIPEVRARRQARMQSIQMTGPGVGRKKSIYPMVSEGPAENLPTRAIADKLIEAFNQKAQVFWPVLHEKVLEDDVNAVYNDDSDPYRNFVVRMVIAISLQKLDTQYAGLADSYYLGAMKHVEEILRPKDLKTLQCLMLIAQYSMLTPIRTPTYYVVGLATRICQQEGLTSEKTITTGYNEDPQSIDMRRRLVWAIDAMELGLAHSMGRPSGFATADDHMDVSFFSTVDDQNITPSGIVDGPPSERKQVAIHFYKLRMCQAEIRRTLYEKKRPEPKDDTHPWYERIEKRMKEWLDASPEQPAWSKAWFTGRYHQMKIFMYRPSPQVPKPSPEAGSVCFESAAFIVNVSRKQLDSGAVDITWVFLLSVNMALNVLLWSMSYSMVRQAHPREEVEELIHTALDVLEQCSERWPGTASAAQLYAILAKACLLSYDSRSTSEPQSAGPFASPPTLSEAHSSPDMYPGSSQPQQQAQFLNAPQFGQVFDSSPAESMNNFAFDPNFPPHPTFRSNSIFRNPATSDALGRRFSYFPPDSMQAGEVDPGQAPQGPGGAASQNDFSDSMPTPPESLATGDMSGSASNTTLSPPDAATPIQPVANAPAVRITVPQTMVSTPPQKPVAMAQGHPTQQRLGNFTSAPHNSQPNVVQRPLPTVNSASDWFATAPPFISPYNFGALNNNFYNDALSGNANLGDMSAAGLGLQGLAGAGAGAGPDMQFDFPAGRHGSLTQSQQLELMNVLETEGMGDIDAFLNAGNNMADTQWF